MQLVQLLVSGAAQGCIYGLIALGFVLIYKATETVSFAQGDLMMVGAFIGLACMTFAGFPFWLAVPASIVAMAAVGFGVERIVIRPILGEPAFSIVMLTIGIGYVARGLITMIPGIGTETHALPVPYKDVAFRLGGLVLAAEQLVIIGVTAALCAALYALFRYTRVGLAMQAASQNQLAAYYMGIPVKRLNAVVWALAAMVAVLAVDVAAPGGRVAAWIAGAAAIATAARAVHWGAQYTARVPLLWILHVTYAWIPVGLALRVAAWLTPAVPASLATHALTVGAIGGMTLGMMARVALGHTGRALEAGRAVAAAFVLVTLAALVRVGGPLALGAAHTRIALHVSGTLWTAAFVLFLVVYAPILARPRADGKPG